MSKEKDLRDYALSEHDFSSLIPTNVNDDKITLDKTPYFSSTITEEQAVLKAGGSIDHVPLRLYSDSSFGNYRRKDNQDLLRGSANIFKDVAHYRDIRSQVRNVISVIRDNTSGVVAFAEEQHLPKMSSQRSRARGCNVAKPFSDDIYLGEPPNEFKEVMKRILIIYAQRHEKRTFQEAFEYDFDPSDTSTGMPLPKSKTQAIPTRLLVASSVHPPSFSSPGMKSAHAFLDDLDRIGLSSGLRRGDAFSAMLAYRHGATDKYLPHGHFIGGIFKSSGLYRSLYNRTRQVYPASYIINMCTSDVFNFLHSARQNILGFWHTPELQQQYIPRLRSQGKYTYTIDFKSMDQHIGPGIIKSMMEIINEVSNNSLFGTHLMIAVMDRMSVLMPSWNGDPKYVTSVSRVFGFGSGWKNTGDFDSVYAQTIFLAVLNKHRPGTLKDWEAGKFVFLDLGDDILFTLEKPLDEEVFKKDCFNMIKADLQLQADVVFLQKIMPLGINHSVPYSPLSRVLQQSLYNEDDSDAKIPAIMILGTATRLQGTHQHPVFKKFFPLFKNILSSTPYGSTISNAQWSSWEKGNFMLTEENNSDILRYMKENPGWLVEQAVSAKYKVSSAQLLSTLSRYFPNIAVDAELSGREVRKQIFKQMMLPVNNTQRKILCDEIYKSIIL